jgi:hypothetical protein
VAERAVIEMALQPKGCGAVFVFGEESWLSVVRGKKWANSTD